MAPAAPPAFRLGDGAAPAYFTLRDGDAVTPSADLQDAAPPLQSDDPVVSSTTETSALDDETRCLAAAVYYEARGEPAAGQMAVAQVVLNRARSGRFAPTVCGVVRQPGQFAFAHRTFAPAGCPSWTRSVAIARAAMAGDAEDRAHGALYFHASYAAPTLARASTLTIGRHVFYR